MKITVVGTGYVGLVTGTCFSETGVNVTCVDVDAEKIKLLKEGNVPIYEPGLAIMINRNVEKGRLRFTTSLGEGLQGSDAVFIAVGTPPGEDGSADLQHVLNVASEIGRMMTGYLVVVIKSTVPVGTSKKVQDVIKKELGARRADLSFDMASNPEFLKEGSAVEDFLKPERIVIGTATEKAAEIMKRLYQPFLLNNHPIYFMDIASSEITKYAANSMLAVRISFMNEIANLCDILGADINQVRKGIGSDSRIGNKFLYALNVVKAAEKANNHQKKVLFGKIMSHFKNDVAGKTIAVWGLAFKPQTDDVREAPALILASLLLEKGAKIKAYDPAAMHEAEKQTGSKITYSDGQYEALEGADALALMTEWAEFRIPDLSRMAELMKGKVIFDGRNIYDPSEIRKAGFEYYGIGRR